MYVDIEIFAGIVSERRLENPSVPLRINSFESSSKHFLSYYLIYSSDKQKARNSINNLVSIPLFPFAQVLLVWLSERHTVSLLRLNQTFRSCHNLKVVSVSKAHVHDFILSFSAFVASACLALATASKPEGVLFLEDFQGADPLSKWIKSSNEKYNDQPLSVAKQEIPGFPVRT